MNRDMLQAAIDSHTSQLRQLQERIEAVEARQNILLDELNKKYQRILLAIGALSQRK